MTTYKYSPNDIPILEFQGEYRFLSNFVPAVVSLDNKHYPTVEHAYQASKTTVQGIRNKFTVGCTMTPAEAKAKGKKLELRPDWEFVKVGIMTMLVRQKFNKEDYSKKLLATGSRHIFELNTWGDTFWGVTPKEGGENILGEILMQVRAEIGLRKRE